MERLNRRRHRAQATENARAILAAAGLAPVAVSGCPDADCPLCSPAKRAAAA